jgi:hypothetical protein
MMLQGSTRIAGKKSVEDWNDFRVRLEKDTDASVWQEAFNEFLMARLESRYFKPVKALEKMELNDGEGFAIVTLHCTLIEFLATIIQGKTFRNAKKADLKEHEYGKGQSQKIFVDFLQTYSPFQEMFPQKELADDFYSNVRCGLLHEAQTRAGWRIRVCPSAERAIDVTKKVVYRDKMQEAFDQFLESYKKKLCETADLQNAFIRKFDALCQE